jgi:hypothetical protein
MQAMCSSHEPNNAIGGKIVIPDSIYRLGHSDLFGCRNCKVKGDKPFMMKHPQAVNEKTMMEVIRK